MPILRTSLLALILFAPGLAQAAITCSQLPDAQHYVDGLRPGPNTRAAEHHLDLARAAPSDRRCVHELRLVDVYAKRSAAADRRATRVRCADFLHQDRPGGSDYRGPPVAACR